MPDYGRPLVRRDLVKGERDTPRMAAYLEHVDADLVGITELSPAWLDALRPVLRRYPYRLTAVEADAYGIGLFSKRPLQGRVAHFPANGPPTVVARSGDAARAVWIVVLSGPASRSAARARC